MCFLQKETKIRPNHPAPSRQSPVCLVHPVRKPKYSQGPECLPPTVPTPCPLPRSPLPQPRPRVASRRQLHPGPLLTASWGWCRSLVRREWRRATPRPPTRLSALCTHWYSEPPGAGPADGPTEPAAAGARGPRLGPARSRPPRPPPPPWLPPCAAARGRWARVKGHSERRPARPFAAAHPGSHCGDWRQGPCACSFNGLCPRPLQTRPAPPRLGYSRRRASPRLVSVVPAEQVSSSGGRIGSKGQEENQTTQHTRSCQTYGCGVLDVARAPGGYFLEQMPRSLNRRLVVLLIWQWSQAW